MQASATRILFVAGSARTGSFNVQLAEYGARLSEAAGIPAAVCHLGDYPMPIYHGDDERAEGPPANAVKLKALFGLHTGILIASPEYNASFSPLLKNALDWVSRVRDEDSSVPLDVFRTRVFALASASPGGTGGIRGLNAVRTVLELGLGALVLPDQVLIPRAANAFDDTGRLSDATLSQRFKEQIEKLAYAATALHGDVAVE